MTSNKAGAQNDVIKKEQPLSIHGKTTVSIPLPEGFVNEAQDVYVQHKGYEYEAQVKAAGEQPSTTYIATFTNPHGFSAFTVTKESAAVAEVNGNRYTSFQDAVDAAGDKATVEVLKNENLTATMSGSSRTITVKNGAGESITVTINGTTKTIERECKRGLHLYAFFLLRHHPLFRGSARHHRGHRDGQPHPGSQGRDGDPDGSGGRGLPAGRADGDRQQGRYGEAHGQGQRNLYLYYARVQGDGSGYLHPKPVRDASLHRCEDRGLVL